MEPSHKVPGHLEISGVSPLLIQHSMTSDHKIYVSKTATPLTYAQC